MDNELILQCEAKAREWLSPAYDAETRAEVERMLANPDKSELVDAFYQDLEFGTGGLRGIMGAGTNRMNIYTIGMATQGFANYINKAGIEGEKSVVVGHDCRNNGRYFAETVANIFSANGIKVYLFEGLRPTPELSFAIRRLGACGGVNVTASHNPKEYNGYKAYWSDGAQVITPHDKGIIAEVAQVKVQDIKFDRRPEIIKIIGGEIDYDYMTSVLSLRTNEAVIREQADLNIVYSAMHGTGRVIVPLCLRSWGFQNINVVPEQMVIDGNFPTVVSPNPENAEAMTLGMKLGSELNADLVVATDPDADRLAIVCRDSAGEWMIMSGNQTFMVFVYYLLKIKKNFNLLRPTDFMVKTIVSTEMVTRMTAHYGVELRDCYTGFKWIAREIAVSEGQKTYIGGGEESFGFLPYDAVRDKDAPASICLICEIAAWAKSQGKTLYDLLMDIYIDFGFSKEHTINVVRPGKSGADEIKQLMQDYRSNPPKDLGGSTICLTKDFLQLTQTNEKGEVSPLDMPETSNVLQWFCHDGTKVSVRPSGTEPKIKFYLEVHNNLMHTADDYPALLADADRKIEAIKKSLRLD